LQYNNSNTLWLDKCTKDEIAHVLDIDSRGALSRYDLEKYQLMMLNKTLMEVQEKSAFYQEKLLDQELNGKSFEEAGVTPVQLSSLAEIGKLPFTTIEDIKKEEYRFYCVFPDGESQIYSINEKGKYGESKKIIYSQEDQARACMCFSSAVKHMIKPKDRCLILLPCRKPGIQGDLVRQAIENIGANAIPYGPLNDDAIDWGIYLELLNMEEVTCIIGTPSQVANLAEVANGRKDDRRYSEMVENIKNRMTTVILGMDFVKNEKLSDISKAWDCNIYEMYGSSEIGIAAAVSCDINGACHLREADLYFEVIDPATGAVLPDGESGELVVTTLTRNGMPLIRFRTGNRSRIMKEPCSCGSVLKRIERVKKRL